MREAPASNLESETGGRDAVDRLAALEQQYRELANVVGGLAHEIRNPLSTIRMNVQLLAEDLSEAGATLPHGASGRIETVVTECDRLAQVLDDVLRFARLGELHLVPTRLNDVVGEMLEFSRARVESQGLVLREDLVRDLPEVGLDRDAFKQAVLNLMLNAEAVMKPGGELILRTRREKGAVILDVIDTGPGMLSEVLGRIFEPFYSTRPGGTGLGLSMTKRIVEAHGGQVRVDSERGKGTAFHLLIPTSP